MRPLQAGSLHNAGGRSFYFVVPASLRAA